MHSKACDHLTVEHTPWLCIQLLVMQLMSSTLSYSAYGICVLYTSQCSIKPEMVNIKFAMNTHKTHAAQLLCYEFA